VSCRIRAATPRPGVDVKLAPSGKGFRIVASRVCVDAGAAPGAVQCGEGRLRIGARGGWIDVVRLQAPGRKAVDAAEFLRGARLGSAEKVDA